MRRWPDPRTLPFDPAYGYFVLGVFAVMFLTVIVVLAVEWWQATRVKATLHTEWNLAEDGQVFIFDGCGCPIGHDHWQDGEPHRD